MARIAVLGWGSLLWEPRDLAIEYDYDEASGEKRGRWQNDGPILPIEFARISSNGRLTLVLYPEGEAIVTTYWAYSTASSPAKARENLKEREGPTLLEYIGILPAQGVELRGPADASIIKAIEEWRNSKGLDAVVWTNLPSNFKDCRGCSWSVEAAIDYLKELINRDPAAARDAEEYLRRAPKQVCTKLRDEAKCQLGWSPATDAPY